MEEKAELDAQKKLEDEVLNKDNGDDKEAESNPKEAGADEEQPSGENADEKDDEK